MSDFLYDSLDEEKDVSPADSLDTIDIIAKNCVKYSRNYYFHNGKIIGKGAKLNSVNRGRGGKKLLKKSNKKKNALPKIESNFKRNGLSAHTIHTSEEKEVLDKNGLQLNDDGSFSKSPRSEFDRLPFVTREYRNLQFQKKKTYKLDVKKLPVAAAAASAKGGSPRKKDKIDSRENSTGKLHQSGHGESKSAREKKGSIGDGFSSSCYLSDSNLKGNLTDAMKEILLRKHGENTQPRKLSGNAGVGLSEKPKPWKKKFPARAEVGKNLVGRDKWKSPTGKISGVGGSESEKTAAAATAAGVTHQDGKESIKKSINLMRSKVFRNRSDISLICSRPQRLSYSERHQREIGFNPLCLRYDFQKCLSDTNRSNFGDSIACELPEISTGIRDNGNAIRDEGEESFYRDLIERDRRGQTRMAMQRSTRSESHLETRKLIDLAASSSCKDQKEFNGTRKSFLGCKNNSKLTAIDMPAEVGPLPSPLKKGNNCHHCPTNPSAATTKAELALKARAYGFMVNARNVFKLKSQSESKNQVKKKSEKNSTDLRIKGIDEKSKIHDQFFTSNPVRESNDGGDSRRFRVVEKVKKSNGDPEGENLTEIPREKTEKEKRKSFLLPRFKGSGKDGDFTAEILQQMRYCLDRDISYRNLKKSNEIGRLSNR